MNRFVILAAFSVGSTIVGSAASGQEIATFDSPYQLTARYDAWATPGATLKSNPTNFETKATAYGSGYFQIYPSVVDIGASNTLQLDVTINSGVAGFLVDLDDGEGDEWQWLFGYGFVSGGGVGGGNEYILQQPLDAPNAIEQGAGTFDFTQITGYNIELDPGSNASGQPNSYDVDWNDLSGVSVAESLTWNNTGGTGDGATWDIGANQNWNNGVAPATYADGSNVTFNDTNNGNYNVTLNTVVSPGSITVNNSTGNYIISGTGSIAGTGSLTKLGSDTLTLATVNTYSGGTTVSAGTLVVGVNGALPDGSLAIIGGKVELAANTGLAQATSLTISANAVLDIGNNHMIIDYAAGTQVAADAAIRAYLISGRNGGAWNGTTGIISSGSSGSGVASGYSIGYADGADGVVQISPANPLGLSTGQIEVKYTLLGDANLDGVVNGDDFTILVGNLGKAVTGWDKGDFLYTGSVTGDDFTALVSNLGKQASGADVAIPAADIAAIDAFEAANGFTPNTPVVPEPASASLLLVASGMLAHRRRSA